MGEITQEVNIEMLEKLADGNFKRKNPKTTKAQAELGNVENYGISTEAEAEAGTSNVKYMTPLRVKEALSSFYDGKQVYGKVSLSANVSKSVNLPRAPFLLVVFGRSKNAFAIGTQVVAIYRSSYFVSPITDLTVYNSRFDIKADTELDITYIAFI